ncbi:hypothetical protein BX667DRAFT_481085 [Coemansia mojavensis]|nr:hypothetical protein BX667DRAFT_481085 [Coemansia mojavensis]
MLKKIEGRCVLIDPNRHDLLYCMHENSTFEDPQLLRYTCNQQSKKFSNICEKVKTKAVGEAEGQLAEFPSQTLDITKFIEYLQARAQEPPILREFYEGHLAKYQYIPGIRDYPLHRKLLPSSYSNNEYADA